MEKSQKNELLRTLPAVHELQKRAEFDRLLNVYQATSEQVTKKIQQTLAEIRRELTGDLSNKWENKEKSVQEYIWEQVEKKVENQQKNRIVNLINATGTVLHTNLGRARLSEEAINHVVTVAGNYSNLEYEIEEGKRGSRHDIIEDLIVEITGAEAAMVVNNNAAAVYLTLRALAKDKEVIVSRGELIEIGGSFRVSSIMEESGARLIEVGTTNKTHLYDYEQAINEQTAMVLKVHTSNFKTVGFTESVGREELSELCSDQTAPIFYEDLGSGSIYDFQSQGIGDEPVVRKVLESGVDVISFSGDKLLGGPQAGIIAGKKEYIKQLKKHQLARVLRVDKMTLAGLEKTLRAYIGEEEKVKSLPTVRDIVKSKEEIKQQAVDFKREIEKFPEHFSIELIEDVSQIGGGTMPDVYLPTIVAAVKHTDYTAAQFARVLRKGSIPVITRVKEDAVLIDFRTITQKEMHFLLNAFTELA